MRKNTLTITLLAGLLATLGLACGDESTNANTANNGAANNGENNGVNNGENNGAPNNGTENNGTENNGANNGEPMRDCSQVEQGERPSPRGEMMGIYDSPRRRIVFFGGDEGVPVNCSSAPQPPGGLWVYDNVCEVFEEVAFTDGPGPRARGVAASDTRDERMILFGGRYRAGTSGSYELYNETWALKLADMTWERLHDGSGTAPQPRVNTAAVYHPVFHELIVWGGNTSNNGAAFSPRGDLWFFDLDSRAWRTLATTGEEPSARLFHAMALDADNNKLYVYGGGDENAFFGPFFGDLYELDLGTLAWTLLHRGDGEVAPAARIWATMTFHKGDGKLYLFGGHDDGIVGNQNDTWAFNLQTREWEEIIGPELVETQPNGFCDFPANFTQPNLDAPDRREAQLAVLDDNRGEWFVFGGKTDCGIIDDIWTFDLTRQAWIQASPATIGESCVRGDNPDQCVALCN